VSELVALKWRDCQPRGDGGQITVFGKGGKTLKQFSVNLAGPNGELPDVF
jgi:hypothetical protein